MNRISTRRLPTLVVLGSGVDAGRRLPLAEGRLLIGRAGDNDLQLADIHVSSQQAGVINNAGRDQHIYGAQTGNLIVTPEVLHAVSELSVALDTAGLPTDLANQAKREVNSLKNELQASSPDKPRVAGALQRLTGLLVAAGPLATAASSFVVPIQTLATWLGTVGAQALRMLPALG